MEVYEYKTLIIQDISSFPGPHVTDIDGRSLLEDLGDGEGENYNYIPLYQALNRFGKDGWQIDQVVNGVIDGAIMILKRRGQG